jgi:predicted cupin superfamily sugar epimerase
MKKTDLLFDAEYWISKLEMNKHPEGGYYKEIYRSAETVKGQHLPERFGGERHHSTSIYFLLCNETFSAFHRIKSDELWHFYTGSAVRIHIINEAGDYSEVKLGSNPESGEVFQYVIPHGCWFSAETAENESFALVGCTVSPGFHFDDFEMGKRDELVKKYPAHKVIIEKMTIE